MQSGDYLPAFDFVHNKFQNGAGGGGGVLRKQREDNHLIKVLFFNLLQCLFQ